MSPTLKKVLLIGGAAVVGYVVYTKMKKPAPVSAATTKALLSADTKASQFKSTVTTQIGGKGPELFTRMTQLGLLEELGLEQALGSLGGKRR